MIFQHNTATAFLSTMISKSIGNSFKCTFGYYPCVTFNEMEVRRVLTPLSLTQICALHMIFRKYFLIMIVMARFQVFFSCFEQNISCMKIRFTLLFRHRGHTYVTMEKTDSSEILHLLGTVDTVLQSSINHVFLFYLDRKDNLE